MTWYDWTEASKDEWYDDDELLTIMVLQHGPEQEYLLKDPMWEKESF
jgi:hypothetical protein